MELYVGCCERKYGENYAGYCMGVNKGDDVVCKVYEVGTVWGL